MFHEEEHSYVFPTRLGRCQILGIRWMACFLQERKGADKYTMSPPAYDLSLDQNQNRVNTCFRFSNKQNKVMNKITLPVIIIRLLKFVNQGCMNPRTQVIKHRANHSSAELFMSMLLISAEWNAPVQCSSGVRVKKSRPSKLWKQYKFTLSCSITQLQTCYRSFLG